MTQKKDGTVLIPGRRSSEVIKFDEQLRSLIVGQNEAVTELVNIYQSVLSGMSAPGRPIANLLLLGPTGSGKTRLVEAGAEILFSTSEAVLKIDCAEFQHSHEISKLLGSPPGYIGHRETSAVLNQDRIDAHHTEKLHLTFLLFDEIEKASDSLWQLLLGILDKGILTLGDNRKVSLHCAIIFMTSNLGAVEMVRAMTGGIGFVAGKSDWKTTRLEQKINRVALDAANRRFSPEFMNRIDKVLVFQTLNEADLRKILDIELGNVQTRIFATQNSRPFALLCTDKAKSFLLGEGTDAKYGARHLKRAIEHNLILPLSSLLSTEQIRTGDTVTADISENGTELQFTKIEPAFHSRTARS